MAVYCKVNVYLLLLTTNFYGALTGTLNKGCNVLSVGSKDDCLAVQHTCFKSLEDVVRRADLWKSSSCHRLEIRGNHSLNRIWNVSSQDMNNGVPIHSFSMVGMGYDKTTISCRHARSTLNSTDPTINGGGIIFTGLANVLLENIKFQNCGGSLNNQAPLAAVNVQGLHSNVNITDCSFTNSSTYGLAYIDSSGYDTKGIGCNQLADGVAKMQQSLMITRTHFEGSCIHCTNVVTMNTINPVLASQPVLLAPAITGGGIRIDLLHNHYQDEEGCINETGIFLYNCSFKNNHAAIFGGGACINVVGHIDTMLELNNCRFVGNTAGVLGGGAYVSASNPESLNIVMNRVTFSNNSAANGRDLVYESIQKSRAINHTNIVHYEPSTVAMAIDLNDNGQEVPKLCVKNSSSENSSCCSPSQLPGSADCTVKLMLGERMYVFVNNRSSLNTSYALFSLQKSGHSESSYALDGISIVNINTTITQQVSFSVVLRSSNSQFEVDDEIVVLSVSIDPYEFEIGVILKSCSFGYTFDKTKCECYENDNVVCDDSTYTACVRFGHWFGSLFNSTSTDNYTTTECTFGQCNYAVSGSCPHPTKDCYLNGKIHEFFCSFENPNDLCLYNKGGAMCSKCKPGYHPTFPDLRCILDKHCSDSYVLLQAILYFLYLLVALVLVLLAVRLDLRIGSGQIYGLVFYFTVFQYFIGGVFPSQFLYIVNVFISGVVQFNPAIFGMLPICTNSKYLHLNRFDVVTVELFNPILLTMAMFLIVCLSRTWLRSALFRRRSGINALCIMLYICFISITQTTVTLLHPITLPSIPGLYTFLDPTVPYFGRIHWFYGVLSLVLQLVLVIPFLVLLLFSPFLIRFRQLNLTKIKPILDEFQDCYKTEYRYFAGFYLACRQLVFLMSFLSLGNFGYIYVLQILSIFILAIHYGIQPYKSKTLNVLDGLLILDLVLLSILHGNTAEVVFKNITAVKQTLVYSLVLLPVLYFIALCFNPITQRYILPLLIKYKSRIVGDKRVDVGHGGGEVVPNPAVSHSTVTLENSAQQDTPDNARRGTEREPLLFSSNRRT